MIYSRGPVIIAVEILSAIAALAAIVALVVAISDQAGQIAAIQHGRERAAEDSCFLLRGLVFAAAPRDQLARARQYIDSTALRDCSYYGRAVVKHP